MTRRTSIALVVTLTVALTVAVIATLLAAGLAYAGATSCKHCGMSLPKFAHTAMKIVYADGTVSETCSIRCAALDFALNLGRTPKSITVGDYNTKKQINAETAVWVIDDKTPGTMTERAKWAFENKQDAESYVKEHGGIIATFDDSMRASYEDMYKDTKTVRERRQSHQMNQMHNMQNAPEGGGMMMEHKHGH